MVKSVSKQRPCFYSFFPFELEIDNGKIIATCLSETPLNYKELFERKILSKPLRSKDEYKKGLAWFLSKHLVPIHNTSIFLVNHLELKYFKEWLENPGCILEEIRGKGTAITFNPKNKDHVHLYQRYWSLNHFKDKNNLKDLKFLDTSFFITPYDIPLYPFPNIPGKFIRIRSGLPWVVRQLGKKEDKSNLVVYKRLLMSSK